MNQSYWNVNWNCNSLLQNNRLSFNLIFAKMAKKMSGKLKNSQILLGSGGTTPAEINQSHWNAHWNCKSLLQSNKPSFSAIAAKMAKLKKS
jgi:hypothetical protein